MANLPDPEAESLRLELQEAVKMYRHQTSLLVQISGFIVAADSILIAYGFSQRVSGILLVASIMPVIMLASYVEIMNLNLPSIYVAMALEQRLQLHETSLITLYAKKYAPAIFTGPNKITDMMDPEARESVLGAPRLSWLPNRAGYILSLIFILQIGLFLISLLVYHYRFM
jgi:hypothetical protein